MIPKMSSHPAFKDPRHAAAITHDLIKPQPAEVQPLLPVNMHSIKIPAYWPGDEHRVFIWDNVEYFAAPRSLLRVGSKLRHQQDDKGNLIFNVELEQAPNGDPATIATALVRRYGDEGLVILGADEFDEERKKQARQSKYEPWRYEQAKKNVQRHRDACARAMRHNVPSPIPPTSMKADEAFIRWFESGSAHGNAEERFVCQPDGSRWPTRKAAWDQVRRVDASKVSDPSAVFDTMHEMAEPGVDTPVTAVAPVASAPLATREPDALESLKAEAKELKLRAFDEDIKFLDSTKEGLGSDDIEILQIAIEEARNVLDGPSNDTIAGNTGL